MIVRTSITSSPIDEDGSKREYNYILQGHQNLAAKVRGYQLPPKMKADAKEVIRLLMSKMGLAVPEGAA